MKEIFSEAVMRKMEALQKEMHTTIEWMKARNPALAYEDCRTVYLLFKLAELSPTELPTAQECDATEAKSTDEPMAQNTTKEPVISQDPFVEKHLERIKQKMKEVMVDELVTNNLHIAPTDLRMASVKSYVEYGKVSGFLYLAIKQIAFDYAAYAIEQPLLNKYKNEHLKLNGEPVIDRPLTKRMRALISRLENKKKLKSSYHLGLNEIYLLLDHLSNYYKVK